MTTDHLTPEQKAEAPLFFGDGSGWGFGVGVVARRDDVSATPGRFGWAGGYGTSGYSDPDCDGSRPGRHLAPQNGFASTGPTLT